MRDCAYGSESNFDERWETRTYDLSTLTGVELFLSCWSSSAIAHTILSWKFAGAHAIRIGFNSAMRSTAAGPRYFTE